MKLIKKDVQIFGEKRQHFPYLVEATCPECGEKVTVDFKYDYLSEPLFGQRCGVPMLCDECGNIEVFHVIPRITLEIVE